MKQICLSTVAVLLAGTAAATAADELEPVVVSATRMAIPATEPVPAVIVIDRAQIERSLAADVAELLRFHAGLEFGRNGGPGQSTSLFIRGTESNHALVLIDGVEINPGTLGGAALQNISPRLIERIEVVKGPRSSLYGSEAIGGVVNIITRRTDGFEVRAGAGRYATREASLAAGVAGDRGALSVSLSRFASDGFPTRSGADLPARGYLNRSAGLNAALDVAGTEVALRHWRSEGNTEYLDFGLDPVDQDYRNQATALALAGRPAAHWSTTVTVSDITDDIEQQQSPDFARTGRTSIDWQNDLRVGERHRVVAGLYLARESARALSFGTAFAERTTIAAVYLEDYIDLATGQLLLAARYSDHDGFGDATTWNAEYGHRLGGGWRLIGAVGTGFRAPDATDRFGFGGNPDLHAERSRNVEVGVDRRFAGNQFLKISLFQHDIDDLIEFTFDRGNLNVDAARVRGLDAAYRWRNRNWQVNVNALVQDPEDRQTGDRLARRARQSLTVNAVRHFDDFSFGLDVLATSQRRDSPFSAIVNAGYVLADINAAWQLTPRWSLQARIENLLDRDYETAAGFRSPGRGLYLAASFRR